MLQLQDMRPDKHICCGFLACVMLIGAVLSLRFCCFHTGMSVLTGHESSAYCLRILHIDANIKQARHNSITTASQERYEGVMADLKLFLFGEPRLELNGSPVKVERRKSLALLAYLTLSDQRQNRDVLATLLWPELDQTHARAALRSTIYSTTDELFSTLLKKESSTLSLNRDALWIDVDAFETLLRESRAHRHEGNMLCKECAGLLDEAAALYRDDFMIGFSLAECAEYESWQITQREWLRRELAHILRRLATFYASQQQYEIALKVAQRWLSLDPLQEVAQRMLMTLYAASGQRAAALRQYQQCVDLLNNELATPPEQETRQLFAAIQAESNALPTLFTTPSSYQASILPALPSLVVGREKTLQEIRHRLDEGESPRQITVIQGWPGVGKSTTVAALAHDLKIAEQFSDGVLWASLGESPNILSEVTIWADALGLVEVGHARKIETVAAQLAAALRDKRMLLIVDDVWQVEHAIPFIAGGQGCAVILTTRLNDVAQALAPTAYDIYHLPVLSQEDALELLTRLSPETVSEYPSEARELVSDLEGLPLAIQVAGRLLHTESRLGWGIGDLIQELRSGAMLLQAQAPGDMAKIGQDTSPTIAALLQRSTDSLDQETRWRFAVLGLFVPKPATFDLGAMAVAWNIDDPKPTARMLVNRGLLEPVSGGRFQMHALLVLHARSILSGIDRK